MTYRLWHAQFDVYDTIRRYVALLSQWAGEAPTRERLFISDFYLCNPPLLHKTRMTSTAREAFRRLRLSKENEVFLRYPATPVLFERMSGVQGEALANLAGRGLIDLEVLAAGQVRLSPAGRAFSNSVGENVALAGERALIRFLTEEFIDVGRDIGGLRSATGLRRIGL